VHKKAIVTDEEVTTRGLGAEPSFFEKSWKIAAALEKKTNNLGNTNTI